MYNQEINQNLEHAKTILSYLGGNKFMHFTGTKSPIVVENGIQFKLARNKSGATHLKITYDEAQDLYDVVFSRVNIRTGVTIIDETKGAFCDMLTPLFENTTGLWTGCNIEFN